MGGTESYLDTVISPIAAAGYEVAFFYEVDRPAEREPISLLPATSEWCVENGGQAALEGLRQWRPDLIYVHGLADPSIESLIMAGRRSIRFAHNHSGLCVSGTKTFAFPNRRACKNRLGWGCLLNYYPRRCGGLNPITAWQLYQRETHHSRLMHEYSAIVTGSAHMRCEYLRQGIDENRVHLIPYPLEPVDDIPRSSDLRAETELNILFAGQMLTLKGGDYLIDALPIVADALQRRIHLTFIGDGPAGPGWKLRAKRLQARNTNLTFEFRGWLSGAAYENACSGAHLIVIPSVMQEAFGLSGLEVARYGIPAVAFALGGITEWCVDGVNGHLARADPPTVAGLATAIVQCLADSSHYGRLSEGARARAREYSVANHLRELTALFDEVGG